MIEPITFHQDPQNLTLSISINGVMAEPEQFEYVVMLLNYDAEVRKVLIDRLAVPFNKVEVANR